MPFIHKITETNPLEMQVSGFVDDDKAHTDPMVIVSLRDEGGTINKAYGLPQHDLAEACKVLEAQWDAVQYAGNIINHNDLMDGIKMSITEHRNLDDEVFKIEGFVLNDKNLFDEDGILSGQEAITVERIHGDNWEITFSCCLEQNFSKSYARIRVKALVLSKIVKSVSEKTRTIADQAPTLVFGCKGKGDVDIIESVWARKIIAGFLKHEDKWVFSGACAIPKKLEKACQTQTVIGNTFQAFQAFQTIKAA